MYVKFTLTPYYRSNSYQLQAFCSNKAAKQMCFYISVNIGIFKIAFSKKQNVSFYVQKFNYYIIPYSY